jgi:lysophospholipase L1-like esterase
MKTIVCYGDSNTWGFDPASGERFARNVRWPGVLRDSLGAGYEVIEEGLSGRTTVWEHPAWEGKNGKSYLLPCLESHAPLDFAAIMLGTNDLAGSYNVSVHEIAWGAEVLAGIARRYAPHVLLIAPPVVVDLSDLDDYFAGAKEKSARFGERYSIAAADTGAEFLDASKIITSSSLDGIHLEASEHRKLGEAVAAIARRLLA